MVIIVQISRSGMIFHQTLLQMNYPVKLM